MHYDKPFAPSIPKINGPNSALVAKFAASMADELLKGKRALRHFHDDASNNVDIALVLRN